MGSRGVWQEGHLRFVEHREATRKTSVFEVTNDQHTPLGHIRWFPPWRRYVFHPVPGTLYDTECLNGLREFIHARMAERKKR